MNICRPVILHLTSFSQAVILGRNTIREGCSLFPLSAQSESERGTERGVAVDLRVAVTNTAAGAKIEEAAAERSEAAAETVRAGIAGAPHGITRSTGQWLGADSCPLPLLLHQACLFTQWCKKSFSWRWWCLLCFWGAEVWMCCIILKGVSVVLCFYIPPLSEGSINNRKPVIRKSYY